MGMRWRFVLAPCTDTQAGEIGRRCQPFLEHIQNPIKVSLLFYPPHTPSNSLSLLELVAFASREPRMASVPPVLAGLFAPTGDPATEAGLADLRSWAHFILAKVASDVVGEAHFGIYSDTLNCSGLVHFAGGRIADGYVYGLGGTDLHLRLLGSTVSSSTGDLRQYDGPIRSGLQVLFPGTADPLAHIEAEYEPQGPTVDYLLMEQRALITPPRRSERGAA